MRQRPYSPLFRISCKIRGECTTPRNYQNTAVASTWPHISNSYARRSAVPSLTVRTSSFGSWNAHSEWNPSCWRLGLIVSELITNAERHAFRNAGGCIRVELLMSQSFAECRVTDDGTNEGNICPGHGLTIVEALVRSLGGTLDQHFGPQGATSVLIFPHRPLNETSCIDVE
jgi:hypothetical protein